MPKTKLSGAALRSHERRLLNDASEREYDKAVIAIRGRDAFSVERTLFFLKRAALLKGWA